MVEVNIGQKKIKVRVTEVEGKLYDQCKMEKERKCTSEREEEEDSEWEEEEDSEDEDLLLSSDDEDDQLSDAGSQVGFFDEDDQQFQNGEKEKAIVQDSVIEDTIKEFSIHASGGQKTIKEYSCGGQKVEEYSIHAIHDSEAARGRKDQAAGELDEEGIQMGGRGEGLRENIVKYLGETGIGDVSSVGEGEDSVEEFDEDSSEEFSGEEDEVSFDESVCRETNFEADMNEGDHAQTEDEEIAKLDTNINRGGYNPGLQENLIVSDRKVDGLKDVSPIKELNSTSPLGSTPQDIDQKYTSDRTPNANKDPSSQIADKKSPFIEDTQLYEDNSRNFQGVSEKMKVLLSRNTPIKEKLDKIEKIAEEEENTNGEEASGDKKWQKKSKISTLERRVTRSQTRQKDTMSKSISSRTYVGSLGVEQDISVGVENRLEEIGSSCVKGREEVC
ncbi:hypothetical protein L2E82_31259 [Cichorium intybus]|uniref:Uncharacterized protein n=1 Tax=Cichorium intybus TaxID=13427 RepID=A0ACB9D2R7_CICIN|nr:hypothetical protein L2E82_31259 [Cichorium intybus]